MIVTQAMKDSLANLSVHHRTESERFWHLWYALTLFSVGQHAAFVCPHCSWEPAWIGQAVCPEHANLLTHEVCEGSGKEFRVKKVTVNPGQMSAAALEGGATEDLTDATGPEAATLDARPDDPPAGQGDASQGLRRPPPA